ncbi:MAG: phosphoribosylglycinamide formyltransferase [Lachnospiraceae bacterium]|nr:phosphoribosylglycinamide formyltransferase [Lachnospiraceae bacterium]
MLRVVVCVSGSGTNLQAIIDGIAQGAVFNTEIVRVVCNNPGAGALERAKTAGIEGVCVSPKDYTDREQFEEALVRCVEEAEPDLIVLAGFLVKVPAELIKKYQNKIINIHPSLIPAFCGTGFYGLRVHEAALARGVKITGATVHFVDDGMDTGPIIKQKAVKVYEDDTPETLQRRVMEEAEWVLLPWCINLIAAGQVKVENGRVTVIE